MPAGDVNRTLLESFYQNPGEIYDDAKTEGAFDVLADQIDENWAPLAEVIGGNGSQHVGSPATVGVAGTTVYDQIVDLVAQIQAIIGESIPTGSVTYDKLASDVIAAFVNVTGDSMTGLLKLENGTVQIGADADYIQIDSEGRLAEGSAGVTGTFNKIYTEDGHDPTMSGTYTGNGSASRDIALPFTPSAVIVTTVNGTMYDQVGGTARGGLAVTGSPALASSSGTTKTSVSIGTNKFTIAFDAVSPEVDTNTNGAIYHYIAFR